MHFKVECALRMLDKTWKVCYDYYRTERPALCRALLSNIVKGSQSPAKGDNDDQVDYIAAKSDRFSRSEETTATFRLGRDGRRGQ